MEPDDEAFRASLRGVLERSGLSARRLSQAMGRDPGYIAASLDPARPPRARPTPADLLRASSATSIPLVELLEMLWGIPRDRFVDELGLDGATDALLAQLTPAQRAEVADFIAFLASRRREGQPDCARSDSRRGVRRPQR